MLTTLIIMTFLLGQITGALEAWYLIWNFGDKLEGAGVGTRKQEASWQQHEQEAIDLTKETLGGTILS